MADNNDMLGAYAWAVNDPELGPILKRARDEGWSPDRLQGAIQSTDWWRRQAESQRNWEALKGSDPAQYFYLLDQRYRKLHDMADQMGVRVTDAWLQNWAESSLRLGWSDQQQRSAIAGVWQIMQHADTGGVEGQRAVAFGQAADAVLSVNALASDYGVQLSDDTKQSWVSQILGGLVDADSFKSYLIDAAKSRYNNPGLLEALDRGVTVRQYADPYIQLAAQELEIDPNTVDLGQDKWQRFLDYRDPTTGAGAQMTLGEWRKTLRSDKQYGWDTTVRAKEMAASAADGLLQMFGRVG